VQLEASVGRFDLQFGAEQFGHGGLGGVELLGGMAQDHVC
jgi:hypothetical protein